LEGLRNPAVHPCQDRRNQIEGPLHRPRRSCSAETDRRRRDPIHPLPERPQQAARHYQVANLYLHSTRADTFPTTVLEALACGTPVVGSAVSGIPEQVVEGRTGFLVPVGDARAMAERVLDLLADEGLRVRMGREAAEDAARRFGRERMVGEYLAFYDEILSDQ